MKLTWALLGAMLINSAAAYSNPPQTTCNTMTNEQRCLMDMSCRKRNAGAKWS